MPESVQSQQKCQQCGRNVQVPCAWRQGRCPHNTGGLELTWLNNYQMRYYNLLQTIKNWIT